MTEPPEQPPLDGPAVPVTGPTAPVAEPVTPARLQPVTPAERVVVIDILRGFALFGILVVNMALFAGPFEWLVLGESPWTSTVDRVAGWAIRLLAEGKFYSLFAFLFGLGVAIQSERAEARGVPFAGRYVRRLLVLLLIGACHAVFIWAGDILVTYAVLGFILLLFRRRRNKTVVICAIIALAIPLVLFGGCMGLIELARMDPEAARQIERGYAENTAQFEASARRALRAYGGGSFSAITAQRLDDYSFNILGVLFFMGANIVAMFLLGLLAGRRRILLESEAHGRLLGGVIRWGFGVGLLVSLGYTICHEHFSLAVLSWTTVGGTAFHTIGAPALGLAYAAAIVRLAQREDWRRRLAPLAAVGRMSLSNYLLQSLICTTVFYSHGLALFGKVGPAVGLALTVAIYLVQIPLSVWWLRRFRFGPAEWLWRSLTYRKLQPMRLKAAA